MARPQRPCRLRGSCAAQRAPRSWVSARPRSGPADFGDVGATGKWARLGSNQQLPVCETGALPLSYSPMSIRVEESNLDLHVQSVVSCRLDDPGTPFRPARTSSTQGRPPSPPPSPLARSARSCCRSDVFHATRQPFDPGSRRHGCAAGDGTSYVEGLWSPSLTRTLKMCRRKQTLIAERHCSACAPRVFLSQAGPRFDLVLLQAEHHLSISTVPAALERKGRPAWVALVWLDLRLES